MIIKPIEEEIIMAKGLIGKFRVCEGGGASELASRVSNERIPIIEIRQEKDEYLVSSLGDEDIPKGTFLFPLKDIETDTGPVEFNLLDAAREISRGNAESYIFKYKGGTLKPIYEVFRAEERT